MLLAIKVSQDEVIKYVINIQVGMHGCKRDGCLVQGLCGLNQESIDVSSFLLNMSFIFIWNLGSSFFVAFFSQKLSNPLPFTHHDSSLTAIEWMQKALHPEGPSSLHPRYPHSSVTRLLDGSPAHAMGRSARRREVRARAKTETDTVDHANTAYPSLPRHDKWDCHIC